MKIQSTCDEILNKIDGMSGEEFEKMCVMLLGENGFYNLQQTPSTGDHGVDIIAWRANRKFVFQCKRHSGKIGNKAVQEVYTGKKLYSAGEAVVITNSFFTKQAIEEASDLGVMLWDRNKLETFIERYNEWNNEITEEYTKNDKTIDIAQVKIHNSDLKVNSSKIMLDKNIYYQNGKIHTLGADFTVNGFKTWQIFNLLSGIVIVLMGAILLIVMFAFAIICIALGVALIMYSIKCDTAIKKLKDRVDENG